MNKETLKITGMTCAACAARIEKIVGKMEGVEISVNLATERATVNFDPKLLSLDAILNKIDKAGYGVANGEINIKLKRIGDSADAARLEKSLSKVEGIVFLQTNLASDSILVRFIPTIISQPEIYKAIAGIGYGRLRISGNP